MVDGTALEMRRACKGSVGSNPTLSAIKKGPLRSLFYGELGSVDEAFAYASGVRRSKWSTIRYWDSLNWSK